MKTRRIGLIGYDGVTALDIAGPADAFHSATELAEREKTDRLYEVVIIGLTRAPFTATSGLRFKPHAAIAEAPPLDTLIVPGVWPGVCTRFIPG